MMAVECCGYKCLMKITQTSGQTIRRIHENSLESDIPIILAALAAALWGCAPTAPAAAAPVRIAVLPIVEGLPLYAAQDGGFFEKQGLKVEFIPTSSAAERDQLIAAGQADATINDLLAVALFNRDSIQLQVVRFAHVSSPGSPMYVIAAAPDSGFKNVKDLAGHRYWHFAGLDHRLRHQPHADR